MQLERINETIKENINTSDSDNDLVNKLLKIMKKGKYYACDELMGMMNLKSRNGFRNNYLRSALNEGLIEMQFSDKPTSNKQKYHKI